MKKIFFLFSIISLVAVVYSCKKSSNVVGGGTVSLDLPATPYNYFPNSIPDTIVGSPNNVATLGRVLFYDTHLSVNNAVSCGSCHKQALAFADNAALSSGFQGLPTKRNTIAITDEGGSSSFFWDGRENNIRNLALRPLTNHVEMGIVDSTSLTGKLASLPYYSKLFIAAYGDNNITSTRISSAIALFMEAITSDNTRLDQFNAGNTSVLTAQELEGKFLFDSKYNCGSCHNNGGGGSSGYGGGSFDSTVFLDNGLDATYTDFGRGTVTGFSTDYGKFKVPDLRNVAVTGPYMHDGRFTTLDQVLDHYSSGVMKSPNLDSRLMDGQGNPQQVNIPDGDRQAIIAFLGTLTDYSMITDPKFSNPFKVN